MTKNEAREAGKASGIIFADNAFLEAQLLADVDGEYMRRNDGTTLTNRQQIADSALSEAKRNGFRAGSSTEEAYVNAFKAAAMNRFFERRHALPEIKRQNRIESLRWTIDGNIKAGDEAVEKFKQRLDENPAYAFGWADSVAEAAARRDVALTMRRILDGVDLEPEHAGYDAARAYALDQTIRGARYPQHSTSALSNQMHAWTTAAWAEYALKG